jgi:hypothetical protein
MKCQLLCQSNVSFSKRGGGRGKGKGEGKKWEDKMEEIR